MRWLAGTDTIPEADFPCFCSLPFIISTLTIDIPTSSVKSRDKGWAVWTAGYG